MKIALLTVHFVLHGCSSLKEKRQRLGGLAQRIGKQRNLAVSEAAFHDDHGHAEWWIVAMAANAQVVDKMLAQLDVDLRGKLDAEVADIQLEWLH